MGVMYGADAEELEQIAAELEGYERELGQLLLEGVGAVSLVGLSATLKTIWMGNRSDEFAAMWEARHLVRIRDVQSTLSAAANDLRTNAADQRRVSESRGIVRSGITGPNIPGGRSPNSSSGGEDFDRLEEILDGIGFGEAVIDGVISGLEGTDPAALAAILDFLDGNPFLAEFAEMAKFAGDVGSALLTFAKDFVDQYSAGLPIDEIIVHASIEMAVHVAADKGIEWVSTKLGLMVGSAFAGVGAPVGAGVGWIVGQLGSIAATELIGHLDGLERIADLGVEAYRLAELGVDFVIDAGGQLVDLGGEVIGAINDAGEIVIDSVVEIGGDVVDGIQRGAENIWTSGGDVIDGVLGGWEW